MKTKIFVPALLVLLSTQSIAASRIRCPEASDVAPEGKTLEDYQPFFSANKIIPKTDLSLNYVEQFKNHFEKFPESLRLELIKAGNKVHIMEGTGVTADPTWIPSHQSTFDGRPWSEVPGGGGTTARGYRKAPTRIVINHLYDNHGSVDMVLHEHGHSLDSIYKLNGISKSAVWTNLMASQEGSSEFLRDVCGNYCAKNIEEGFAELLAHYHACEESRDQMEREVPKIAEFFKRLKSAKNVETIWEDPSSEKVDSAPESRDDQVRRRVRGVFRKFSLNNDE